MHNIKLKHIYHTNHGQNLNFVCNFTLINHDTTLYWAFGAFSPPFHFAKNSPSPLPPSLNRVGSLNPYSTSYKMWFQKTCTPGLILITNQVNFVLRFIIVSLITFCFIQMFFFLTFVKMVCNLLCLPLWMCSEYNFLISSPVTSAVS